MSIIKVEDVAYVRFRAPDLDAMEAFLIDFGMVRAARDNQTLYMRGTGTAPYVHITELGDPGFAGVAFRASSRGDLEALATSQGTTVESLNAPGGGHVVRLTDPDGFSVEAVSGQQTVSSIALPTRESVNDSRAHPRTDAVKRIPQGAAHVVRLGHCVLNVSDFRRSEAWYKERFGFITSDEISLGEGAPSIGAFMRCDRGETPTDHHTLFLAGLGQAKFNHAAFEVADMDDLMAGNAYLKSRERAHEWGVGRHFLGSQIFDYWRDPWGYTVEHWTDGDLMRASWGSRVSSIQDLMGVQWGMPMPPTMG
ncbi:MAG: glyoxalase [Alphaproteobacteria bacterium]|nr:glyoxalase [Alphaproteobacteria bacterium]